MNHASAQRMIEHLAKTADDAFEKKDQDREMYVKRLEIALITTRRHLSAWKLFAQYDKKVASALRHEAEALRAWKKADEEIKNKMIAQRTSLGITSKP